MPSLIPGFEYDIFISYRQKDNKHDGWVTEFVDQLRGELESTFKEEISVYFDINPHDGLLETHDVDESLKEKLKCLIFIPIISRTYCDPKSFAWEHEFKAFVEQASKDRFGLKIKLPNGNVASRVLPVQIHDLKPDDKALVENVLGGFLRSIEFIYKEPGVNRSLTDKDSENKNLNKTNYRNQINKVANAIDEIITALEQPLQKPGDIQKEVIKPVSVQQKRKKFVLITASVILAVLVVIGIFFLPKLTKASEKVEKSIAVLPFINDSPSDSNKYFIDGIMVDILNNLQTVKDLRVISRTSAEKYRNTSKSIPEIAKELGVNYIVEGSGQKSGNTIRLSVQLLTVAKESRLWGDSYEKELHEAKDIFDIQSQIAKSITSELKAIVTPHEKQLIDKIPTKNLDAYEAVLKGNFYLNKFTKNDLDTAFKYFELAKEKDPDYAPAYFGISGVWGYRQQAGFVAPAEARPKSMEALMKAVEIDSTFSSAGFSGYYCWNLWDWEKAEKEFKKGIDNNPNDAGFRRGYSHLLIILGRNDEALKQIEVAVKLDPLSAFTITWYGIVLTFAHRYDEAIKVFQDALKMEPIYPFASGNLGITLELSGKKIEALEQYKLGSGSDTEAVNAYKKGYIEGGFRGAQLSYAKLVEMRFKKSYWNPTDIAITYVVAGEKDKALYWLEQGFKVHDPNMPYLLHPIYDSLRDDPRFQDLCKRMKLPYK